MDRSRRSGLVTLVLIAVLMVGAEPASAAKKLKPCKLVKPPEIEAQFGGPVAKGSSTDSVTGGDCTWIVGEEFTPPGGAFHASILSPSPIGGAVDKAAPGAVNAVQQQMDFEAETFRDADIHDVAGVGQLAWLNGFTRQLNVAVNDKFAFSVQWSPADTSSFGVTSPEDEAKLVAIAQKVAKRCAKKRCA